MLTTVKHINKLNIDNEIYDTVRFAKTEKYCPHCGSKSVWIDIDNSDFYHGRESFCDSCEKSFHILRGDIICDHVKEFRDAVESNLDIDLDNLS